MVPLLLLALLAAAPDASPPPGPLTLDDALALAARQNPDLRLARLQGESAGVDEYASWAGVLPRLDLNMGFGYSYSGARKQAIAIPQFTVDQTTGQVSLGSWQQQVSEIGGIGVENYALGLQLAQPIFDGLRGPRLIQRAKLGTVAAARQVDELALTLALEVTRRFYEVVKADRSFKVLEETVTRSDEFSRRAAALYEAGRVPKSEVLAAQVNLGNDRINLELQRSRVLQSRADLAQSLALPPAQVGEVAASSDVDSDALALREAPAPEQLLEKAKLARPAFARARTLLEQAQLDGKIAWADHWPVITGALAYDRTGPTFAGKEGVWGDPTRQFVASVNVGVQWNLFNGRQTMANEQRAAIAERVAQVQAEQLAVQVEADLARARANVVMLGRAVALGAQNLQSAEEGVRLAQQRLEAGAATQLEVRDANLKLTQAKLTLVNARIDALVARADLSRAAGGAL
jgi:outer membrane protein